MDRLYRSEIPSIVKSLKEQRQIQQYADLREHWAFLAAVTANGFNGLAASMSSKRRKPKEVKAEDFINKDFRRAMERLLERGNEGARQGKGAQTKASTGAAGWASHVKDAKAKGLKGPWQLPRSRA